MNHINQLMHGTNPHSATQGRTIQWAFAYDAVVRLLTLNREPALREESVQLASIQPGDSVLDVGCGTGELTLRAKLRAGQQGSVVGIDAAPPMIQAASSKARRKHSQVKFQVGVIEALDFPDQSFDVVMSSLMIHHLPDDLKAKGLVEMYRVLKPGGRLLIIDFKVSPKGLDRGLRNDKANGVGDVALLLQKTGFTELQTGDLSLSAVGFVRGIRPA